MTATKLFRLFALGLLATVVVSIFLLSSRPTKIQLVVLLVIDQFRPEYLERFGPALSGGLREIYSQGVVFENAHFQYALTETCPGHATIVTGTNPRQHGIVANHWLNRETGNKEYCVASSQHKKAPSLLRKSTLADWIKSNDSNARIFSIAGKDRSAIMLGGYSADAALWFETDEGVFTSSSFYDRLDRGWLRRLNSKVSAVRYFGSSWEYTAPMRTASDLNSLGIVTLSHGDFSEEFPHPLGGLTLSPDERFYGDLAASPLLDTLTLDAAQSIIATNELGRDSSIDLIAIGLSAQDRVGHSFGPDSPEILDSVVRIDASLATFLAHLDHEIGRENYLLVLTSDHGVRSIPEVQRKQGRSIRRPTASDVACMQRAALQIASDLDVPDLFLHGLYLNQSALARLPFPRQELDQMVAAELTACQFVDRVISSRELDDLRSAFTSDDATLGYYFNSYFPARSQDYFLTFKDELLDAPGRDAAHGSVGEEDRAVPVVFFGAGLAPGKSRAAFPLQDLAPTIASLLQVSPLESVEGRSRLEELQHLSPLGDT